MNEFIAGKVSDFEEGKGRAFNAGGRIVAIFRSNGQFFGFANRCPHKGASLCAGELSSDGLLVRCPWHNWAYDLNTGRSPLDPNERIRTYPVRTKGEYVVVEV